MTAVPITVYSHAPNCCHVSLWCTWVSSGKDMTLLTFAGMWIQIAALNRIWSQSCLRRGAPWVRPFRYLAKARNCSRTALVTCIRDAWETIMRCLLIKTTSNSQYLYKINLNPASEAWRRRLTLQLNKDFNFVETLCVISLSWHLRSRQVRGVRQEWV